LVVFTGLIVRLTLAWVLVSSGADKMGRPGKFATVLATRSNIPAVRSLAFARSVGGFEMAIGCGLCLPVTWAWSAIAGSLLFIGMSAVVAGWYASGQRSACGCGGLVDNSTIGMGHLLLLLASSVCLATIGLGGVASHARGYETESVLALCIYVFANILMYVILRNRGSQAAYDG
jgi:uncharacterized membrane protein YphA (DoxX/SURF4 family)